MSRQRLVTLTAVLFVLGVSADVFIGYSPIIGYGAAIGLFGCIGLIVGSKLLGNRGIYRPEDHYPDETPPDVQPDHGIGVEEARPGGEG